MLKSICRDLLIVDIFIVLQLFSIQQAKAMTQHVRSPTDGPTLIVVLYRDRIDLYVVAAINDLPSTEVVLQSRLSDS